MSKAFTPAGGSGRATLAFPEVAAGETIELFLKAKGLAPATVSLPGTGEVSTRRSNGFERQRIVAAAPDDPVMQGLPAEIVRRDEWYYFKDFREDTVLLTAFDPVSIGEPGPGLRPLSWRHEFEGARIFYTGMGHTEESFSEVYVRDHIAAGLRWVLSGE